MYLELLKYVEKAGEYEWGITTLAYLYRDMSSICYSRDKQFAAFSTLFKIRFFSLKFDPRSSPVRGVGWNVDWRSYVKNTMVKTRRMVLEERITFEMLRLKLKYFGDRSLEMLIPAPVPPTYQGMSEGEAVKAEEDFYCRWRFHVVVLIGEERWACLRTLAEDNVRPSSSLPTLRRWPVSEEECQLEGLDVRGRELEYASYFSEVCFRELAKDPADREEIVGLITENTKREAQKYYRGFGKDLFEGDQQSKRVAGIESRRWLYISIVREGLGATADSHYDIEGRAWNDNVIWAKDNYLQRNDDEPLDLLFRTVKQSPKFQVESKDSLLNEVAEEEVELEFVLEGLGLCRRKKK
ncbi:hypothetical protein GIB67_024209, partial [Kingdonia uniflora]